MELKDYQKRTLEEVRRYLEALAELRGKYKSQVEQDPDLAFDYAARAWSKIGHSGYMPRKNGIGEPLADFYLKIPTGGGKTLLACHCVDMVQRVFLRRQTGVVLWIVPTTQIYRQTLKALEDRSHPYRQVLDIASAGRTLICEKSNRFTRQDVTEKLLVMLLMLPSANRLNKETLRAFKDSGGYTDFFPPEDDSAQQAALLKMFPNLDYFGLKEDFFGRIIKTSLGNTLRILKPLIIIDEGQKAYSQTAQATVRGFNPALVIELSATPPQGCNILVNINGQELNKEEMIKLDMNVFNKVSAEWEDTVRAALERLNWLAQKAREYESNTGEYIRPIALIQVERTGSEQRGKGYIHSEDVKDFLISKCGILPEEVAIKSSEKDDIEGIDLLSRDCQIKYIITKYALQEGWDCAFAYILAILTNPTRQLSITQLVGRILRQPRARKTKIKDLDECYIYCYRQRSNDIIENIRRGFQDEGLGDLAGNVVLDLEGEQAGNSTKIITYGYRERFKKYEGKIYLPKFVVQEKDGYRDLSYEMDLLSRIDWSSLDLTEFLKLDLQIQAATDKVSRVGLSESDRKELIEVKDIASRRVGIDINYVFLARQLCDIVPNPWIAFRIGKDVITAFINRYDKDIVSANFIYIIEELRKALHKERDRMSELVFRRLLDKKKLCFYLLMHKGGYKLPSILHRRENEEPLRRRDWKEIQRSLFEFVPKESLNDQVEQPLALCLDSKEKLLWWYRNRSKQDYYIQGWQKNRVYADFIFEAIESADEENYSRVYVMESKGAHLKNENTEYKQDIFAVCNRYGEFKNWSELGSEFPERKFVFEVVFGNKWEAELNRIFSSM